MLPILSVGPLAIQLPGLILLAGVWLGLTLAEKTARWFHIHPDRLYSLVMISVGSGLLGGRLSFILQNPQAFSSDLWSVISLNPGLFDPIGGAAAGLLGAWIYGRQKAISLWPTLDALTPFLAVIAVAVPAANLASGAGFGSPTTLPWGIDLWGATRHPTQVYETLAALAVLAHLLSTKSLLSLPPGVLFWYFTGFSAGFRLFLEVFRGDSVTLAWGLRLPQVIAWLVLFLALWQIRKRALLQPDRA